jgi:hypothetical protein
MRQRLFILKVFLSFALVSPAFGITIRDDVSDAASQTLASDPAFASVGQLTHATTDITSGVLIDPSYVLTAGHVVGGAPASEFVFTIGGATYAVSQITLSGQDDLALFQLATPVLNVTPALLYTGSAEVGNTATLVGFGYGGNGTAGTAVSPARPQGVKRAATNVIDKTQYSTSTPGRMLFYDFDDGSSQQNAMGTKFPTTYEGLLALGDSGSGLFATINSTSYLVGINTSVFGDADGINYNYGDVGGAVRVSTASSFISSTVPEPGTAMSLLAGVGLLFARRRAFGFAAIGRRA